jgi:hypothetical protein
MPVLNPGYFDVKQDLAHGLDTDCAATVMPDALEDDAIAVTWLGVAALAITIAGAIFAT